MTDQIKLFTALQKEGINSFNQGVLLLTVAEKGESSLKEIANTIKRQKSTIYPILNKWTKKGLIEKSYQFAPNTGRPVVFYSASKKLEQILRGETVRTRKTASKTTTIGITEVVEPKRKRGRPRKVAA